MLNVAFINPNSESKPFKKVQQIKHIFISELFYLHIAVQFLIVLYILGSNMLCIIYASLFSN